MKDSFYTYEKSEQIDIQKSFMKLTPNFWQARKNQNLWPTP